MKLFKKLMAAALAGVMALSVFTGCATVNKKSLVDYLNDSKVLAKVGTTDTGIATIEEGDGALAREVLNRVATYAKNHTVKNYTTEASAAAGALGSLHYTEGDYAHIDSIVPKDTKDAYYVAYAQLTNYKSDEYQSKSYYLMANSMQYTAVALNKIEDMTTLGDKAVASIASKNIGGETFVVAVFVQAAK